MTLDQKISWMCARAVEDRYWPSAVGALCDTHAGGELLHAFVFGVGIGSVVASLVVAGAVFLAAKVRPEPFRAFFEGV